MKTKPDVSYPIESAESKLAEHGRRVKAGTLSLDDLACEVSLVEPGSPVTVRNHEARPVVYSRVYFRGEALDQRPWGTKGGA